MELQYCPKCISMTNHNEVSGQCLRCKSILSKDEPQPEAVRPKQIPAVIGCDSGWIKCDDRLPEIGQEVLIHLLNGSISIDEYINTYESPVSFSIEIIHTGVNFANNNIEDITHWMPLPKPPNHGR